MAKRKKNPSTGAILVGVLVVGGLGYWAYTSMKDKAKKELQKGAASATETITVDGWKIKIKGLGDGTYKASVQAPDGTVEDLGTFASRDEALAAAQVLVEEGLRGG